MLNADKKEVETSTREFFSILAPKLSPEQLDGFAKAAYYQAKANEYFERATVPTAAKSHATA